jgi:FixJ family two-component response regulator
MISLTTPIILVIDDDASLRTSLSSLLRSSGFAVECFASIAEFSAYDLADRPCCLLLDVRLQGSSGLDFQAELNRRNVRIPIVFMTGHGDIPMSVRAMKAGAVDFLAKPFRDQDLLDALSQAIEHDRLLKKEFKVSEELQSRFKLLTAREREVMLYAASGLLNKQIAGEIGTSEITVKIHRGNAMRKMQAKTFADLVKMAQLLGLPTSPDV